jgi:hypothetical protein
MDGSRSVDPLEELRRANPAAVDDLPSASLARVRASVMGEVQQENTDGLPVPRRLSRRPVGVALAALAAAVVVAVGLLQAGGGGSFPTPTDGPQIGLCVEAYSLDALRNRTFAFDGTVVALDGDTATFEVGEAFRGVAVGEVTLTATGMTGGAISPGGAISLVPGARYLAAGDGSFAWGCGFTQPYDSSIAAQWAEALRQ